MISKASRHLKLKSASFLKAGNIRTIGGLRKTIVFNSAHRGRELPTDELSSDKGLREQEGALQAFGRRMDPQRVSVASTKPSGRIKYKQSAMGPTIPRAGNLTQIPHPLHSSGRRGLYFSTKIFPSWLGGCTARAPRLSFWLRPPLPVTRASPRHFQPSRFFHSNKQVNAWHLPRFLFCPCNLQFFPFSFLIPPKQHSRCNPQRPPLPQSVNSSRTHL